MKSILVLTSLLAITSCSSVDSIHKNANCVVWRDQKIWGPFSMEIVEKQVEWKGSCKGYNNCEEILLTLDENNNLLSKGEVLGKIENNEIHFAEKHALAEVVNYIGVRAYPDQKIVKASFTENGVTTEESYQTNDKCTGETAIEGAVALGLVTKYHLKNKK